MLSATRIRLENAIPTDGARHKRPHEKILFTQNAHGWQIFKDSEGVGVGEDSDCLTGTGLLSGVMAMFCN